jgi:replication factor C subunit 2/4
MTKAESSKAANGLKAQPNSIPNYELPWVEKYRPMVLDDIVGNTETIERLKIIAKDGNMPHVIISGMPGIGKTTSILCLARQLLGDAYKEAVLELNASDERGMLLPDRPEGKVLTVWVGIDVVRNRIKAFAQKKVTLPPGRQKLIILDEADSMTSGAQQALRRTMEIYSSTTRFAFACNQSNKIIEPLQSRCAILRYARLTDGQILKRLKEICDAEEVQYSDDGLAALIFSAEGDMRQAINNLQSTASGFGFVSGENVFRVVDSPHPVKVQAMLKNCYDGKVDAATDGLKELWYVFALSPLRARSNIDGAKGSRLLYSRHHLNHVSRHKDDTHAIGACETRVHTRDRFHAYADSRGCANLFAAGRMSGETLQAKHEAAAVYTPNSRPGLKQCLATAR